MAVTWDKVVIIKVVRNYWMTGERKICVKKILGNIEKVVLILLGISIIIAATFPIWLPYYMHYNFIKECMQENHSVDWCQKTWKELQKLD